MQYTLNLFYDLSEGNPLLEGAIVRVGSDSNRGNPICGNISLEQINDNQKVDVICDLYGQYLSIELPGSGILHICEVQAFNGQCQGKQLLETVSTVGPRGSVTYKQH